MNFVSGMLASRMPWPFSLTRWDVVGPQLSLVLPAGG